MWLATLVHTAAPERYDVGNFCSLNRELVVPTALPQK